MNNQLLLSTYDVESYEHDVIAGQVVQLLLDIPGVREAVILDALNKDTIRFRSTSIEQLGDVPFEHAWTTIFNSPGE